MDKNGTKHEDHLLNKAEEKIINPTGENETEIKDKYLLNFVLIYVLAGLVFLPGAFLVTASDYWMYKFRDPSRNYSSNETRSHLQKTFFASCGTAQEISGLAIPLSYYLSKKLSVHTRFLIVFTSQLSLLTFTLIMVKVDTDSWQQEFYYITLGSVFVTAILGNLQYVTLEQIASRFPPKYIGILDGGSATCGTIAAVVQILSLEIGTSSDTVAIIYFSIGLLYVIFSIGTYLVISKTSPYYKHRLSMVVEASRTESTSFRQVVRILWNIKIVLVTYLLSIFSTMVLQPGVTSLVISESKSNGSQWTGILFVPLAVFMSFNVISIITRISVLSLKKQVTNQYLLLFLILFKIMLVPLIMFCNAQPRNHLPVIFKEDYLFVIFVILLSFSDTFFATTLAILIPRIARPNEIYLTNVVSNFSKTAGIVAMSFGNIIVVNSL